MISIRYNTKGKCIAVNQISIEMIKQMKHSKRVIIYIELYLIELYNYREITKKMSKTFNYIDKLIFY